MSRAGLLCLAGLLLTQTPSASAQPLDGWSALETDHFTFYFPPEPRIAPKVLADRIEKAYLELRHIFGDVLPAKVNFHVRNSAPEGEKVLGRPLGFARHS